MKISSIALLGCVALAATLLVANAQEPLFANVAPSLGWAPSQTFSYFLVTPRKGAPSQMIANITLSTTSGTVWLYIGQDSVPTLNSYKFRIQGDSTTKFWSGNFDFSSQWYVGVYGVDSATSWFYVALSGLGVLQPQMIAGNDAIQSKQFDLYVMNIPANTPSLQIAVDCSSGDMDQYVGVGFIPTNTHFTYANTSVVPLSCISVKNPPPGTYYYMVYAVWAGQYKTQYTLGTSKSAAAGPLPGCPTTMSREEFIKYQKMTKVHLANEMRKFQQMTAQGLKYVN